MRTLIAIVVLVVLLPGMASAVVHIDWVTVGDPGNVGRLVTSAEGIPRVVGAVAYEYHISKYETTNVQHAEFLNAVAEADPNGLYNTNMGSHPEDSLVFPNAAGGFLWAPNFRNKVFAKVIATALGPGRHYTPHCLRHTWAGLHMARGTPLKWIQDQGGSTTAKLLFDTYGHYLPTETHGFADALSTAPNGPGTVPQSTGEDGQLSEWGEDSERTDGYDDEDSETIPKSPIMHFTLPPPFFKNSDTSTTTGVTPRFRTSS